MAEPAELELDLFSGRPNPVLALPPAVALELERRLASLPPAEDAAPMPDLLGYRGLRVTSGGAGLAEVRIFAGRVQIRDRSGAVGHRADPGRGLERWLIEAVGAGLDPGLAAFLREQSAR